MRYLLISNIAIGHPSKRRVIGIEDREFNHISRAYKRLGQCYETSKPPSKRTLRRWRSSNRCRAICGCWISSERGERCPIHNVMSWLTVYSTKG